MNAHTVNIDLLPSSLEFAVFSGDDIKRISVVKIITGLSFDALGYSLPGGLYDNLMGTYGRRLQTCGTCNNMQACNGHMGHIELNALVYNPFFIKIVQRILGMFCLSCFSVQMKDNVREIISLQLRLIDAGYIVEAQELEKFKSEIVSQNSEQLIKLENNDHVHPHIAEMHNLLEKGEKNFHNNTKVSCEVRTAIVNASIQRPTNKICIKCNKQLRPIRYLHRNLTYYISAAELKESSPNKVVRAGQTKVVLADECRKYLRNIYDNYAELLKLLFPVLDLCSNSKKVNNYPVDIFFMDTIPVTPSKARPVNFLHDRLIEHPQTELYRNIIENNSVLSVILKYIKKEREYLSEEANVVYQGTKGANSYEKLYNAWQLLQNSINLLLDVNVSTNRDAISAQGLKQILEKKEGLIRKHMMGKRVNYAARTVITPDPNVNVDEVGVPDIFARKLSYPVPVTHWNVSTLRKMVMNGPNIHPGANYIEDEKGYTTLIPADNPAKRESMAKLLFTFPEKGVKVVHRHVLNGDIMLLNRQPSLHKPSIMAHKVRILHGEKTFRLHYSNCKAYNADFDGDEMNAHLPQSEIARAEAYNLVNVANNYLVPKDGTPLGGLIQDHVISGVKLSIRGRFFNREDYQQLVFQGLSHIRGDITLMPPTIIKPIKLWSGKQILSTIIINLIPKGYPYINLVSSAKIGVKHWETEDKRIQFHDLNMSESKVTIRNGELLTGVLDKQQYGATTFGLIHCMYELYGGNVSTILLTAFTKVFTIFLQREGFTLGVQDILVSSEADKRRRNIIKDCREIGKSAVAEALDLEEEPTLDILAKKMEEAYIKNPKFRVLLDRKYKSLLDNYTNDINKTCLPNGLISKFPHNNLQLMVLSGAKGSMVNTMQISCLLGQIELEGKRPPLMISGKSLPSFTSFEISPKSGGFIDGRFMTGIQPQDFFFHCMAGREGLIDTAVKTSRSGYLQRCLIKHLEGLSINYDLTVRDSDNSVVQFLYGEDGLDILKSKFFDCKFGAKFLADNAKAILQPNELKNNQEDETYSKVLRHQKKIQSWKKKHKDLNSNNHKKVLSPFTEFSRELRNEVEVKNPNKIKVKTGRRHLDENIVKLWKKADEDSKKLYRKKYMSCPDPTVALYQQDSHYGSVSETVEKIIKDFTKTYPHLKSEFTDVMYIKNIRALATPGEPVGLLAAQSIGEPSTQMTLNTFHFAGRGEMNVTLGIPRLREILMLASSNIKTPSMDIPIAPGQLNMADKLRIKLNKVVIADILEFVNIKMKLLLQPDCAYQYCIHFKFLPQMAYKNNFCVRPKRVIKFMSEIFFKQLFRAITKASKKGAYVSETKNAEENEKQENSILDNADYLEGSTDNNKRTKVNENNDNDNDSSDGENEHDDDAMGIKLKSQKQDEQDYDEPDDIEEITDADEKEEEDAIQEVKISKDDTNENDLDDELVDEVLTNEMATDYIYDTEEYLWCQLTFNLSTKYNKPDISYIIRDLANKIVMHEVSNIKRAIIYKGDNDIQLLKTDGINIVEMFKHNKIINLNRLYSNDIHAIAKTYGIEAAAQVIVNEITNVFKVYGITVDRRHLSLIADYMTFNGTFQPLSRKGMEHSSSPLQQMSFESCLHFLKTATGAGCSDDLNSPSSRLMVGLPMKNGTGAFELLTKIC